MKPKSQINDWHKAPLNWKFYFFYYNPNDARLMVSKRTECTGITFNYAHKAAWYWTIFLFVVVFLIIIFFENQQ